MWSIIHSGVAAMRAPGNASISMLNNLSVMVALLKKLPPIYWIVFLGIAGYLLPVIWGAPDDTNGTSVGRREGTVRLHAQFTGGCPAGWRSRLSPFGDGRIGVNTVFSDQYDELHEGPQHPRNVLLREECTTGSTWTRVRLGR